MQDTTFETMTIAPIGSPTPTTIVKASKVPMRVILNNVGPVPVWIGDEVTDLVPLGNSVYRIFPGDPYTFVVASTQSVYAISGGLGGQLSVSVSEAIPTDAPRA